MEKKDRSLLSRFVRNCAEELLKTRPKKKKEREPTLHEITWGERIPFSDNEYFIPDEKHKK